MGETTEQELIKSELLGNNMDQMSDVYEKLFEFIQDLKLKELANMRTSAPLQAPIQNTVPSAPTNNQPKVFKFEAKNPIKKSSQKFEATKYAF